MPTYEYRREDGSTFEFFQSMNDQPLTTCPTTGQPVKRLISGGGGVLYKGDGFYITDYKNKNGGQNTGAGGAAGSDAGGNGGGNATGTAGSNAGGNASGRGGGNAGGNSGGGANGNTSGATSSDSGSS